MKENFKEYEEYLVSSFRENQLIFEFENGWGASVIRNWYSYGGSQGLFELAVLDKSGELHYDNKVANGDVRGYLTQNDVMQLLMQIQNFKEVAENVY